ncbi:unnamed protein product [Symbiodinium pilosum]|uniref:Uncharacterized protein n=1 Tax=Symbiodinium pilosum TaxID=2952 RepID=A0A812IMS4_SYMPI|nr:unnamed protein product [Symbiodinium pilosum]
MRTLALAVDLILRGKVDSVGDIMMQRFEALCMNLRDGEGRYGQFLELLPEDLLGGGAILQETEFARQTTVKTATAEALVGKASAKTVISTESMGIWGMAVP